MKRKIFIFILLFLVLYGVMFIAHLSREKQKPLCVLDFPRGGAVELYTIQDSLIVRHNDQTLYTWQWDRIQGKSQTLQSQKDRHWISPEIVIDTSLVAFTKQRASKDITVLSNPFDSSNDFVKCSMNGHFVGIVQHDDEIQGRLAVSVFEITEKAVLPRSFKIAVQKDLKLRNMFLSEDGNWVAIVAWQNEKDQLLLVDTRQRKVLWEKEFSPRNKLAARLEECVFSPDGESLYAGWIDYHVYQFSTDDGSVQQKLYMKDEKHAQQDRLDFSAISISPNGRYLATGYDPPGTVLIWDLKEKQTVIMEINAGCIHLSGVAFSPDSTFLATTGFKVVDEVKIWKVQK